MIPRDIQHKLDLHATKGGKQARRRQLRRVEAFVRWTGRCPGQIGKYDVREFFRAHDYFAASTQRDYWYAIQLLWRAVGRPKDPPKPWR